LVSIPAHRLGVGPIYVGPINGITLEGSPDGFHGVHALQVGQVLS